MHDKKGLVMTYTMRRISKHFDASDSIRFKRAVEHQESNEVQLALNVRAMKFVNLADIKTIRREVQVVWRERQTLSVDRGSISFMANANTRLPSRVNLL